MSDLGSLQRNRRPHAAPDRTRASVNTSGTRFHRTGRWNCEASSATNEEHWTLLPDHLQRGWTPPRRSSDRLTWCLADTLYRRPEQPEQHSPWGRRSRAAPVTLPA